MNILYTDHEPHHAFVQSTQRRPVSSRITKVPMYEAKACNARRRVPSDNHKAGPINPLNAGEKNKRNCEL